MSDEIVNRLRCRYASGPIINGEPEFGWRDFGGPVEKLMLPTPIMKEAADEIERLRAEVEGLREDHDALLQFAKHVRRYGDTGIASMAIAVLAARKGEA